LLRIYTTAGDIGSFLHVSDFHYDWLYSPIGDPHFFCHDVGNRTEPAGIYGNYLCDAPWTLVESAINSMASNCQNPDFIIWTGDSVPHIPNDQFNSSLVIEIIRNITEALTKKFPNSTLCPVLGNHDFNPAYNLPDSKNDVYQQIGEMWNASNGQQTFTSYGYYKVYLNDQVLLLGLNTNFYIPNNHVAFNNATDPGGQLAWMESELKYCNLSNILSLFLFGKRN
jgi:sphingomyelin phosphodiesterase acid-like 3